MARQLLADWDNAEEAMRQSFTLRGKILDRGHALVCGKRPARGVESFRDRYAGINATVHDV